MRSGRQITAMVMALLVACAAMGCRSAPRSTDGIDGRPTVQSEVGPGAEHSALAVLQAWDRRRATAWADADADALRSLYRSGSAAGERDVRLLGDYRERGLRVNGLRTQVLAAEVRSQETGRLVVALTERFAGAVAVGPRTRVALPVGTPRDHVVVLVRRHREWVVATVREPAPPGRRR